MPLELTQARLKEILRYDRRTGKFYWLVRPARNVFAGDEAGWIDSRHGYLIIRIDGVGHRAHRLAWLYVHGKWPTHQLDHKDRDKVNNAIRNLRECAHQQNAQNKSPAKPRLGPDGTWRIGIRSHGLYFRLGVFATSDLASAAYVKAKKKLHPFYYPSA